MANKTSCEWGCTSCFRCFAPKGADRCSNWVRCTERTHSTYCVECRVVEAVREGYPVPKSGCACKACLADDSSRKVA
jgi:hypothetical protein